MREIAKFLAGTALLVLIATPFSASAQIAASFGGKVTSIIPCISTFGPSLHVTITSARTGSFGAPEAYIWTPATITKLVGPPLPKGQVLGLADTPFACWNVVSGGFFGFFSAFSYLYGLRMQMVGTSFPLGSDAVSAGIPMF